MTTVRLRTLRAEVARLPKLRVELSALEALACALREWGKSMSADDAARLGAAHTAYTLADRARRLMVEWEGKK